MTTSTFAPMKLGLALSAAIVALGFVPVEAAPATAGDAGSESPRPRLAVLTDIGGDPDDQQSMIRLMVYANEFEIEALIAGASGTPGELKKEITQPQLILEIIDAYERVLPNLRKHVRGWPEADALRRVVKSGNPKRGRANIGPDGDSEGSKFLIERIDAGSPERPLNITIWGGQTDLAQALWRVKHDRGPQGLAEFVRKFRVYDINDQDGIADWMRSEFPGMFYILAKAPPGRDKREGTYRGIYLTGDESLTSREWIEKNVQSRGPLGALYPMRTWTAPNPHGCMKEGDTPSWFFFLPRGGNDANDPSKPGWGGQYRREPDGWFRDLPRTEQFDPRTTVSRWRPDFQADFARRMSWCLPDTAPEPAAGRTPPSADSTRKEQPKMTAELIKAIDLALEKNWDEAHRIVQQYEDDATASWIHAVLHKIEGDLNNSRYWYRRANKMEFVDREPYAELREIRKQLAP